VSTAAGTQIQSLAAGNTTTLNITGAGGVTIDAIEMKDATTANTDVATINAADATGNVTIGKDGTSFQSTAADDFAITLGSGTNIVYAEATADDGDTITGTTGTDTVDLADSTGAVNLVNIDTVALSGSSTGTYTASAANWSGIGAVTVGMGTGSRTISNIDATLAGGKITVTDDIDSGDTLTLTGATGVTAMEVTLSGTAISAGTLATNATDFTINVESHDSGATTAINEKVVLNDTQTALTLTGGGVTSSAGTNASLNLDTGSSALIASINSTYDGSLDLAGVYFNTTGGTTVTTGANTNAVTTTVLAADVTNGLVHFNDTAGIDTLTFTTTGADLGVINVDGYETIDVSSYNSGGTALAMNLRDSSGVETVLISGTGTSDLIDDISVLNASSALTFKVGGAYGDSSGADKILVTAAAGGSSDTITISSDGANFTSNHADSQMEVSGYETVTIAAGADDIDLSPSSKEMTLTLTGATALNVGGDLVSASDDGDITLGTLAATSVTSLALTTVGGSVTIGALGTMNSLETFTITSGTGETATVTAGTSTSVDAITITGAGATTITALTAASLDTITASDATGAVTLGSASAAITSAAGATFTTGTGDDAITMSTAASRTLTAGEKTSDGDNLVLVGSMNSGAGVINLSSADQVVTINGSADALVQSEFEDVDVSAVTTNGSYSFTITANAAGSTIVGSGANDVINGGEGADTITGGAGNDTISIAETTNTSDVLKFAAADGLDTITGFTAGATAGDVIQSLVSLNDKNTSENAADATNATNQISASTDFVSETAEVAATDLAGTELVMVFDHVAVDSSIDFRSSTASEIATAIENALESSSSVFETGNNAAIGAGNTGAVKLLVFKDAGTGAAEDAAVVLYQENTSSADADFATELTVLSVLQGVDTTALTIDNFFA
jgi:S-layer protein